MARKEWLNKEEVCKILDISISTLYRYVKSGLIVTYKYGGNTNTIHFKKKDITNFLEKNRRKYEQTTE